MAFVLLPRDHDQQSTRAVLVANILTAHGRAYEIGRNPEHLAEAMLVIDLRKAEIVKLHSQEEVTVSETRSLDTQRAELERLHALALRDGERPSELPSGTAFHILPAPPPVLTREQLDAAVAADPELGSTYRQGKRMADWSIVVLSIGGVGLGITLLMAATFEPKDGVWSDVLPIVVPVGSVMGVVTILGGTLLGVGSKRKKQARQGYRERQSLTATVVPISLPHGGGLGFAGRF
jgi:hypothetical protein